MASNYTTISQIVENFMIQRGEDDYTKYAERGQIRHWALMGYRELQSDILGEIKQVELPLTSNPYVDFPDDYLDYTFIGVKGEDCRIHPLGQRENMYFGSCVPSATSAISSIPWVYYGTGVGQNYGIPTGRNANNPRGMYRVDKENNRLELSSQIDGDAIVLEYIADASLNADPTVHKYAEMALYSYIYHRIVSRKVSVPANEKERARREYITEKKLARRRLAAVTTEEILEALRTSVKQAPKL